VPSATPASSTVWALLKTGVRMSHSCRWVTHRHSALSYFKRMEVCPEYLIWLYDCEIAWLLHYVVPRSCSFQVWVTIGVRPYFTLLPTIGLLVTVRDQPLLISQYTLCGW
jgi:hypothetical protein